MITSRKLNSESWIINEIKTSDLGDKRLNTRLGNILEMLIRQPQKSIGVKSNSWSEIKAAYRFFDNDKVNMDNILEAHITSTIERISKESVVLLPQDTTELNYSSKKETIGLGVLHSKKHTGALLHPVLAVTESRVCLGIVHAKLFTRDGFGERNHYHLPITEKESIRWLEGYNVAEQLALKVPDTKIISVADRECDIYEFLHEASQNLSDQKAHWIVRSSKDRFLTDKDKLRKKLKSAAIVGRIEFDTPNGPKHKGRHVIQEVKAVSVNIKAPYRKKSVRQTELSNVTINAVLASEVNPPSGTKPIEWILLTSLPINTTTECIKIIEWYLCRWQIEVFFKVLKTGCAVEELQLQTLERLSVCIGLYIIIAWRILFMTMLGRSCPDIPCTVLFSEKEWQTAYIIAYKKPPPKLAPTLNDLIFIVAGFGGFLSRKGDGFPGHQSIWIGLQRMRDFITAFDTQDLIMRSYG